jgi:[acyl-carrier-protein] S-malonyltransferase
VSGALHSPLMAVAEAGLQEQLESVPIGTPAFPVVSNVSSEPVTDPAEARRLLVRQLTLPVRWTACMRTMLAAGATRFYELGPGGVLSGLARRVDRAIEARTLGTADEVEELLRG